MLSLKKLHMMWAEFLQQQINQAMQATTMVMLLLMWPKKYHRTPIMILFMTWNKQPFSPSCPLCLTGGECFVWETGNVAHDESWAVIGVEFGFQQASDQNKWLHQTNLSSPCYLFQWNLDTAQVSKIRKGSCWSSLVALAPKSKSEGGCAVCPAIWTTYVMRSCT